MHKKRHATEHQSGTDEKLGGADLLMKGRLLLGYHVLKLSHDSRDFVN